MLFTEPILMALASAGSRLVSSAPRYYRSLHSSRLFLSESWQQEGEEQASALPQNISPSIATANRIQDLISHPAVVWDEATTFSSMHKKKLGRRHLSLFDRRCDDGTGGSSGGSPTRDHLFDQFAQTVCHAGVVARKEIFETWAAACYIYSSFFGDEAINNEMPQINRVADVAAGHGLLAWALLILDDEYRRRSNDSRSSLPPLTAFCLDVTMPRSAEIIHSSMVRRWAHLKSRFDYVEGRLEQLAPHPSCLLASVHGCGILSDILVSTASEHGVPLAVVPCCHSRKRIVLDVASPFAKAHYDDIINMNGSIPDLSERLDEARIIALLNSGHDVREVFLPKIFTDKNRLIIGVPTHLQQTKHSFTTLSINQRHQPLDVVRKGRMPSLNSPIMPKSRFLKGFCVPCKDDNETRQVVTELAGRVAAEKRKEVMHNRFHEKRPQMDISLWLPEAAVGISEDAISQIVKSNNNVECTVTKVGPVYAAGHKLSASNTPPPMT
ncbi:hypothetical protein ACHAW5_001730 [Stephanodiscus triporus]|uniref:Methyltransferase domain-containing protein n=1 Tax=Stephanodiscus triporus TaxID=2934178 RepID=A0ABD3QUU0_9STRA